jgi:hypothetical protein
MTILLSLVDGNAEQVTLQSVAEVVPAEQDLVDVDVEVDDLLSSGLLVTSDSSPSSDSGGLEHLLRRGMQGILNLGR